MSNLGINEIAKICHQANKAYCEGIGDNSQLDWDTAPDWQKDSAVNGVKYHMDNPDSTPADSHVSWMKEKVEAGWVFGEVKDPDKKSHPCIVSYEELPIEQRRKDYLFLAIVRSLV